MTNETPKHCQATKDDGQPCEAWATTNSEYCFTHDPSASERRTEARSKGGQALSRNLNALEPMTIANPQDVVSLLTDTINHVRQGTIDIRVANCIGVLSGHLLKALELGRIDSRVETIERVIMRRQHSS